MMQHVACLACPIVQQRVQLYTFSWDFLDSVRGTMWHLALGHASTAAASATRNIQHTTCNIQSCPKVLINFKQTATIGEMTQKTVYKFLLIKAKKAAADMRANWQQRER